MVGGNSGQQGGDGRRERGARSIEQRVQGVETEVSRRTVAAKEHRQFLERVITLFLLLLILGAGWIAYQLRVPPSAVREEILDIQALLHKASPADVRADLKEVKGVLTDELQGLRERLNVVEAELERTKARSVLRWTSLDMRNWVDTANEGRTEQLPTPVPTDK